MIIEKPGVVDESGVILCPECGEANVHIADPTPLPMPNVYGKGIGVMFDVWCEHCGINDYWRLYVGHHKGSTYLSWFREQTRGN